MCDYNLENAESLLFDIIESAKEIWDEAGCPADFCIQHDALPSVIVFGSTNRVRWSPLHGFVVDVSYCTAPFIEGFKRWADANHIDHNYLD